MHTNQEPKRTFFLWKSSMRYFDEYMYIPYICLKERQKLHENIFLFYTAIDAQSEKVSQYTCKFWCSFKEKTLNLLLYLSRIIVKIHRKTLHFEKNGKRIFDKDPRNPSKVFWKRIVEAKTTSAFWRTKQRLLSHTFISISQILRKAEFF